jgi:hypothetical protein
MTYIEPKKFYWLPTPSAWESAQTWRERRRAMAEQFESDSQYITDKLSTAFTDQNSGTGDLAAQLAVTRMQKAAKEKQAALQKKRAATALAETINKIA